MHSHELSSQDGNYRHFAGGHKSQAASVMRTSMRIVGSHKGGGAGGVNAHAGALQAKGVGCASALVRRPVACSEA